jgi:hypothetical protein
VGWRLLVPGHRRKDVPAQRLRSRTFRLQATGSS